MNMVAARQALAHKEGRDRITANTPPPDRDEMRRMLELARSAKRVG